MPFQSNQDLIKAVAGLVDRLCEKRKLSALHTILPGYLALNGLTDGWYELLNSLKATRALGHEYFEAYDWDLLSELISAVDQMLAKR
jgi:hypothetical protein